MHVAAAAQQPEEHPYGEDHRYVGGCIMSLLSMCFDTEFGVFNVWL